jgi:hypothetical protein
MKTTAARLEMLPIDEKPKRLVSTLNALIESRQKNISHIEAFESRIDIFAFLLLFLASSSPSHALD